VLAWCLEDPENDNAGYIDLHSAGVMTGLVLFILVRLQVLVGYILGTTSHNLPRCTLLRLKADHVHKNSSDK